MNMTESSKKRILALVCAVTTAAAVFFSADFVRGESASGRGDASGLFAGTTIEGLLFGAKVAAEQSGGDRVEDSSKAPAVTETETSVTPATPEPEGPSPKAAESAEKEPETKAAAPPPAGDADLPTLLKEAADLSKNSAHSEALEKYRAAAKKAEASGDRKLLAAALIGTARSLHELGKDKEALKYVDRSVAVNLALKNAKARSLDFILAGRIHMALTEYPLALTSFREAAKIIPTSESAHLPKLLEDTALCLARLYQYSEAIAELNRAAALYAKEGNTAEVARLSLIAGDLQVSRSDYKAAAASFKKAEQAYRQLGRSVELGQTLFRIGYIDQMTGDAKSARAAVEEGRSLMSGLGASGLDALPMMVQGMEAHSRGKVVQAVKDLSAALARYEQVGDRMMAARVRLALATVQLDRSRLKSALELGGAALSEFRSLSAAGGEAAALALIGDIYFRQGFVQKAQEYAQDSLNISKRVSDRSQMVQSRILLAEIHIGMGDPVTASRFLKEALDDSAPGINRRIQAHLHLAVARFRLARDVLDKALNDASSAHREFGQINDRRGTADSELILGMIHELRGEKDKALELLERALAGHTAMGDSFGEGRDLTALGVHFKNQGDQDKALDYFKRALDLRKGIGDRRGYAANLANIGNLLRSRNEVSEALKHLEEALAVYRELSDKKGEADVLTSLGHLDAARGAQAAALEKFNAALNLHRDMRDGRGMATDLASLGKLYLAKGDLDNAQNSLQEALGYHQKIRNPKGEVAVMADLAMVQRGRKNPSAALATLNKALALAKQTNDPQVVTYINLKIATILEDSGEYSKALILLKEALEPLGKQGDRAAELWTLSSIGVIQVKTEDYENALKNLHRAVRLRSELGVPASQARDLDLYLGEIYEGFRDFERALEHYQRALPLAQTPGNEGALGRIYDRIGAVYYKMEDYAKAQDFLEDALRVNTEARNVAMQKSELMRLGDVSGKLGKWEAGLKYQQKALILTRESNDQRAESRVLTRMGTLHQMMGRPRVALDLYQEAQETRTKLGDRRGVSENLLQMALVLSTLGDFDAAVADLRKAFEIAQCSEDRSMLWKAYFIMGRALESQKRLGEALESYRKALTILEAMEADITEDFDEDDFIFGGRTALFETTLRVLMQLARKDPQGAYDTQALRIVEKLKAAAFESTLSRINVDSFSDVPQELLIKEKSLKLALRRLNDRLEDARSRVNPNQEEIRKLLEERRNREKSFTQLKERLTKEYPSYADLRYPRPVSVHQVQREVVGPDEAILEYMVTRSRTYLFAIDKGRFHTFSINYPIADLERDVVSLTRPLQRADTQASWDPSVAYRLYSRLIKPAEYFLMAKKAVVIVPHGPLASLPFQILVDSESHAAKRFWSAADQPSYLVEKYAFCYAPSISALSYVRTRKRASSPGWNLVAFGDAIYGDPDKKRELNPGADRLMTLMSVAASGSRGSTLRPLPGARREITEIVKIVGGPTQTYLGDQATETLFKKVDLSRYAYVHLATHGVVVTGQGKFRQQPAIIFSLYGDQENDGFLQLGEVFGLKLNADMVVLSSCLTPGSVTLGEANGLMSLSRAFLFAGADSLVLALWQVNDEHAAKLFIEMYRNLRNGSKAEALRDAQLSLLKNPGTGHPYYWAPFILMGNWQVKFQASQNRPEPEQMRFKGVSTWRKLFSM